MIAAFAFHFFTGTISNRTRAVISWRSTSFTKVRFHRDPARFSECALGPQRPHRLAFKEPDKAARPIIMRNIEERAGRPAHTHQGFAEVPKERSNDSRAIA